MVARKIEISYKTIIFTVIFLMFVAFMFHIREILLQVFVALLIMTILNPPITRLHKLGIPRFVSVLIVYILVLVLLSIGIALMAGPFIEQTTSFANSAPKYFDDLNIPGYITEQVLSEVSSQLSRLPSQFIRIGISVFSNVLAVVTVFVFALYFLLSREKLDRQLNLFFDDKKVEQKIEDILTKLEVRLGGWARGQMILMFLVGVSTYIGLVLIGVPFAVPLAILAGLLEVVPNVGPVIAAIPAIIVGFGVSPITGLAAAALGVLIQQVENYVFVPKVMQDSAGVNPVVTLLSLLIGFKVAGIVGAILSVPVVITLHVIMSELGWLDTRKL